MQCFKILKLLLNCLLTLNSTECDPAIMSRDRWKRGSYISESSQMCFGHVASIKELYKITFNLMTCWGLHFVLSVYLLSLLWAGTVKES